MLKRLEIVVLLLGILLSGSLAAYNQADYTEKASAEFERMAQNGMLHLDQRMLNYLQSLIATGAYLRGSENVTREEFQQYVNDLSIETMLPGINGIGLISEIDKADHAAFEAMKQAEGYEDFKIYPKTEGPLSFVIQHIFPIAPNDPALGLDITFEQGRRTAARQAFELNAPQMTPRIILVQDKRQEPGFLLLLPLYPDKEPRDWVYAPFVGRNLLSGLTPGKGDLYEMHVYDGAAVDPGTLIYDSAPDQPHSGKYQSIQRVVHFGREWTAVFSSTPSFEIGYQSPNPLLILAGGLMLTAMLVALLRNMRLRNVTLTEITHLRDRQIAAQELENRAVIENAVTPVLILDDSDTVLFANQAACDCFGYAKDEMTRLVFSDLIKPPTPENPIECGQTSDGRLLVLDLQRNDWSTVDGARRVTAIVRNITAETNALQEIQHTKTQYDLALQGAQIGVFDRDLTTDHTEVSDTWCKIMGFDEGCEGMDSQQEFIARLHPEDRHIVEEADAACIRGDSQRSISEYRLKTSDGEWRWMRSDAVIAKRDKDGRALRMIGTQTDVTDLRHARNALETSEAQFRQTLSAAPIGTVILDEKGYFIDANQAFADLCGVPVATLKTSHRLNNFLKRDDIRAMYDAVTKLTQGAGTEAYKAEYPLIRADGSERLGLFHISWAYNKNTKSNVFVVQLIDITEQRRIEKLKDEFVSTVSHELRTPLTSIKGALALVHATRAKGLNEGVDRLLEIASSNADRLTAIVNDILDLERISSGAITFNIETLDLNEVVGEAVRTISPFAQTHGNDLIADLAPEQVMVRVDASRTQQVLANLISNACKYSPKDTPVHLAVSTKGRMARVEVRNSGPGVPEAFRPHIFQAFSQADGSDTRVTGGTGLGLNISQQIVKRQGGDIGYDSPRDAETLFWFTCQLARGGTGRSLTKPHGRTVPSGSRAKVLHLEDDRDFAEVIRANLAPFADVLHAYNIKEAQELLGSEALDAIVVDWRLPDGDASTLLEKMRSLHPNARIISLSGDADRKPDPRLSANMIKSRTNISVILDSVLGTKRTEYDSNDQNHSR